MADDFVFPQIKIGTLVEVSSDPNFTDPTLGFVVEAKTRSANIAYFRASGRFGIVQSALYVGDPRIKTQPNRFDPEKGYDDSGVFRLAASEVADQEIRRDQREIRGMITRLQQRIAELEAPPQPTEPTPKPRRRGRPPKQQPVFSG